MRDNQQEQGLQERNIILVGFMGAGKTEVGKVLSRNLGRPFVDIDVVIEQQVGLPVSEIFAQKGESFFRQMEFEKIREACARSGQVIALGGGAFVNPETRKLCLTNSLVFFLNPSWLTIRERLKELRPTRPLLQNKSEAEIKQLFDLRQGIYRSAHIEVVTDDCGSVQDVADHITSVVRRFWQHSPNQWESVTRAPQAVNRPVPSPAH